VPAADLPPRSTSRRRFERFHRQAVSASSVHHILARHGLNRLPANQKHRPRGSRGNRYERPQPGQRLQLDVKFPERISGHQDAPLVVHGDR
jgi:hypothetical protein